MKIVKQIKKVILQTNSKMYFSTEYINDDFLRERLTGAKQSVLKLSRETGNRGDLIDSEIFTE